MCTGIDRILCSADVVRGVIDAEDTVVVYAIVCNMETEVVEGGVAVAADRHVVVGYSAGQDVVLQPWNEVLVKRDKISMNSRTDGQDCMKYLECGVATVRRDPRGDVVVLTLGFCDVVAIRWATVRDTFCLLLHGGCVFFVMGRARGCMWRGVVTVCLFSARCAELLARSVHASLDDTQLLCTSCVLGDLQLVPVLVCTCVKALDVPVFKLSLKTH